MRVGVKSRAKCKTIGWSGQADEARIENETGARGRSKVKERRGPLADTVGPGILIEGKTRMECPSGQWRGETGDGGGEGEEKKRL